MIPLWILGGGGHAKSVIDAARTSGEFDVVGILDDSSAVGGASIADIPIRGTISLRDMGRHKVEYAVIAIGDNRVRENIARTFDSVVQWATVVHGATYVAPSVVIGPGSVVCAGAVIQPEAKLGRHVIANTSCSIGHDCDVHDFAHVAPGTNLAGGAVIETGVFMGIGSRVIPLKRVGAWSVVGAGAVVLEEIPKGATAVGVPARVVDGRA